MDSQASIEQVAGILVRADLQFQIHEDGKRYRLLFGPDAVFIHFESWGEGGLVRLTSPALQRLDEEDAGYAVVLNRLAELNRSHRFVQWDLIDDALIASHDLLGDDLRASHVLNAVFSMAGAVSDAAGELADATGGQRYEEILVAEVEEEVEDE